MLTLMTFASIDSNSSIGDLFFPIFMMRSTQNPDGNFTVSLRDTMILTQMAESSAEQASMEKLVMGIKIIGSFL